MKHVITTTFGKLFRKFRLRSEYSSLAEFSQALADERLVYEDSTFSRWQNGSRIPISRGLLIILIKIFIKRGGIISLHEANMLLESAGQGYLTESEIEKISNRFIPENRLKLTDAIVDYISAVGKSKRISRTGWVREKIKNPESVAEHCFGVIGLTIVIADSLGLDKEKLIKMALIRGLGETTTGDIVVERGNIIDMKKKAEKEKTEKEGIREIFKTIGKADEYIKIFDEMTERKSEEAKAFWELDSLEMAMQALEYEKEQGKNLEEFFLFSSLQINHPILKNVFAKIKKNRKRGSKIPS